MPRDAGKQGEPAWGEWLLLGGVGLHPEGIQRLPAGRHGHCWPRGTLSHDQEGGENHRCLANFRQGVSPGTRCGLIGHVPGGSQAEGSLGRCHTHGEGPGAGGQHCPPKCSSCLGRDTAADLKQREVTAAPQPHPLFTLPDASQRSRLL